MELSRQTPLETNHNFSDVADDRGVDPTAHAGLGYGSLELVSGEDATDNSAAIEPQLTEAEEREIDNLVDQGRHNYGEARKQVLSGRR